jgi:hypothetical protein
VASDEVAHHDCPIPECDSTHEAVIEPGHYRPPIGAPEHAVAWFF